MKREVNMRKAYEDPSKKAIEEGMDQRNRTKLQSDGRIITDPLGSWTGTPTDDIFDMPVQDVDDL